MPLHLPYYQIYFDLCFTVRKTNESNNTVMLVSIQIWNSYLNQLNENGAVKFFLNVTNEEFEVNVKKFCVALV